MPSYVLFTVFFYFFFTDTPTTEIYTLSLHDALPIFKTVLKKEHLLPVDKSRRAALEPPTTLRSLREVMVEAERKHLEVVLRGVGGHRTKAASVLGISRKVLWEKLKDYGIE